MSLPGLSELELQVCESALSNLEARWRFSLAAKVQSSRRYCGSSEVRYAKSADLIAAVDAAAPPFFSSKITDIVLDSYLEAGGRIPGFNRDTSYSTVRLFSWFRGEDH